MAQASNQELTDRFMQFYRNYYREAIGTLAQQYPNERRSLYVDYDDLYQFDPDLAEDYLSQPDQIQEYAEDALRLYDLPADVKLGNAHVRLENLPDSVDIRGIRVHDNHIGKLVSVQGIVRKATDVRPKITDSAFECQRCGTMNYIPQTDGEFQEPHECQGCERQGPFRINFDQSEFIDAQKIRVQESPEGLRGGEIVGIVGENGSGKSTLMKILVGVLDHDAGTVERHGTVGWCPQDPLLYDRLTVSETFRLFGAGYDMTREEIDAAKHRLADELDFEKDLDYRVDQLSGGNRQKVNLSVALMHDPDVLMLDEPYTGFDWETYLRFWDMAQDLANDGTAVVMISHLIEERSRLDRVFEVRDGLVHDVTDEETESELRSDPEGGT